MIVYKKARLYDDRLKRYRKVIVLMSVNEKLIVTPNSETINFLFNRNRYKKMRARSVKVISITSLDGNKHYNKCISCGYGGASQSTYTVGKITRANGLDCDVLSSCGKGINFFKTRSEAKDYCP